jgi:broad specificity phosphatase PhoE
VAAALALFLAACSQPAAIPGAPGPIAEPIVVYLVRHAERADATDDPPISPAGEQRALLLADMLRDADLTHIYTTDFLRTRQTVAPIASRERLEPAVYDGVGDLADLLRATPGRHLVVGHSNTLPALVGSLGGESHGSIGLDEYDRFYVLTLSGGRTVTSLLRFGAR